MTEAGDAGRRWLRGIGRDVRLDILLSAGVLGPGRDDLAGRRVLLATGDHLLTAAALLELDGLAARIVLCPADVPSDHMAGLIEAGEIEAVVTDRDDLVLPAGPSRHQPAWPPEPASPLAVGTLDTEWVLLTSGTTSLPKLVLHTFEGLTHPVSRGPAGSAGAVWATFYDIRRYGGLQMFFRGMLGGGSLVLPGPGEPIATFLERLAPLGITHLAGTPSHWRRALMSPALRTLSPAYVRLSGEIADQAILDALRSTFPNAVIGHAFASTEAGVAFEVNDGREGFPASAVGTHPSGVEVAIADGVLRIRSPRVARRYLGSDEPIAASDGFVDTGDTVEQDGDRFRFGGRRGGVINVGGLKVFPEEVEAVLNRHPGVRMSVVEPQRSPILGSVVSARIVRAGEGGETGHEAFRREVLGFCRQALPAHKVPAVLQVVESIGVGDAGKIVRRHG